MEKFKVEITNSAFLDMQDIYDYIAEISQDTTVALNQYERITKAILSLEIMPKRIKPMEVNLKYDLGLRKLLVDNYSVIFKIDGNTVYVTNVLYSSSDIENKLI
jgi:plasmid stabilization system protein ParE